MLRMAKCRTRISRMVLDLKDNGKRFEEFLVGGSEPISDIFSESIISAQIRVLPNAPPLSHH